MHRSLSIWWYCKATLVGLAAAVSACSQNLPPGTRAISAAVADFAWDATRSQFWVSTSRDDPVHPSSILAVDPATVQITDQISLDSPASHLAVSSDGQFLYASFDQLSLVRRYPLPSHTPDLEIALGSNRYGPLIASAVAVLPGTPGSFIAALANNNESDTPTTATITVFDGSTPRANTAAGPTEAIFVQSATSAAAWGAGVVITLNISAQGVSMASAMLGLPLAEARPFDGHRYVTDDWGYVFDTNAGSVVGRAAGILRCFSAISPAGDTLLAVNTDTTGAAQSSLTSYSLTSFRPLSSMPLAQLSTDFEVSDNSGSMKTWGSSGLAICLRDQLIFLSLSSLQPITASQPATKFDPSGAIRIQLPSGGLAFDSRRNQLLASVPGTGGMLGNTIAQIDPASGAILGSIVAGSEPGKLSLTDDGSRVFTLLNGAPLVVPVNLDSNTAEQPFSVLDPLQLNSGFTYYFSPEDLVTLPNTAGSVAVVRTTGFEGPRSIAVYDNGVPRPQILTKNFLADRIYRADAPDALFSLDLQASSFALDRLIVNNQGIAIDRPLTSIVSTFGGTFAYDSGRFYSSDGTVWSGAAPLQIGSFAGNGIPVPFADQNVVVYALGDIRGYINVWLFDTTTYRPLSSIQLNATDTTILAAVRTGPTSFAIGTAHEVILMSWGNLQAWPDLTPAIQTVAPGVTKVSLLANAIAAAPDGENLLVGTSSVAGKYGNCVLTISPDTASILSYGYVGSEPVELSVVPGGNEVYASVAGETGIARFNLATASRDLGFSADPTNQGDQYYVWDIAAAPDGSVAASFYDGSTAAFDNGQLRPDIDSNTESFAQPGAQYQLAFNSSGTMLYGYDQWISTGDVRRMSASPNGIKGLTVAQGLTNGFNTEIRWAGNLLYSSIGDVIDPERSRRVAQFLDPSLQQPALNYHTTSKHVWPDIDSGKVYFIAATKILVFDINTYAEIGSLTLPSYNGQATALVKIGASLAFLTSTGDVYFVSIGAIPAIANPIPPPPFSPLPSTPGVGVIDLAAFDLAYNPANNTLYATVPNSEGALGDSVTALDPGTGNVTATYPGAIDPKWVRVSDDGSTVFYSTGYVNNGISFIGEGLSSINLSTGEVTPEYGLVPTEASYIINVVADLVPLPGEPASVAVHYGSLGLAGIRIYDGTVQRPGYIPGEYQCTSLQPGADAGRLYCVTATSQLSRLAVDQNGVTVLDSSAPNLIAGSILYSGGRIYTSGGGIIDPESMALIATVPASGNVAVDSGRIYFLAASQSTGSPTVTLTAFDQNTLQQIGVRSINVTATVISRLVPCGNGRLAFAAGQQIYIVSP